jgi:hypothetical protein
MRRSTVQSNRLEALHRVQSWVDFITITPGSRFSVYTGLSSAVGKAHKRVKKIADSERVKECHLDTR